MTINMNLEIDNMIITKTKKIILLVFMISCALSITGSVGFCADNTDSINAEFDVIKTADKSKFDIGVKLDIAIQNSSEEKLNGSKIICKEDIDSLKVTDKNNNRLLYTVKASPDKRLIWEYPNPENGVRRVKISFMIRDGVKAINDNMVINLDWLGGWENKVLNSNFNIILPQGFSEKNIFKVIPNKYQVQKSGTRLKIIHNLKNSYKGGISVELRTPVDKKKFLKKKDFEKNKRKKVSLKSKNKSKIKGPVLNDIRFARHADKFDRIVFELTSIVNYEINYDELKNELEIKWKKPITVKKDLLIQKTINPVFIESYSWRKIRNKDLVSVIKFNRNNIKVKDGTLNSPPRIYLDFYAMPKKKDDAPKQSIVKKTSKINEKKDKKSEVTRIIKSRIPQVKKKKAVTEVMPEEYIKMNLDYPDNIPIEEKVMYKNANKFFESGDYSQSLKVYNDVLLKFPDSTLKEHILFRIADATYNLAEKKQGKTYHNAAKSYQAALLKFPDSKRASFAVFRIGECKRKDNLIIEAITQYKYYLNKYPKSENDSSARYWIAEHNYRMKEYENALNGFESLIKDYPNGPYLKESYFRLGDCYLKLNDFDRAEYFYEKAFKKWPEMAELSPEALNNIAITFYYKGRFKQSREIFMLSFNRFPEQDRRDMLLRYCADSYQWEGDMQKALNLYGLQLELFPDSEETMLSVVRIADIGVNVSGLSAENCIFKAFNPYYKPEKAYRWLLENDTSQKTWTEANYKIGFLNAKKGNYKTALKYFEKSMNQKKKGTYHRKSIDNIGKMLVHLINQASDENDYLSVLDLYSKNEELFLKPVDDCVFLNQVSLSYVKYGFLERAEVLLDDIYNNSEQAGCRHRAALCLATIDLERGETLDQQIEDEANLILGDVYFAVGEYQDAVSVYTETLKKTEVAEKNFNRVLRLGKSFGSLGYYFNGIHTIKRYLELVDKSGLDEDAVEELKENAMMVCADYFSKTKNYSAAVNVLNKIVSSTKNEDMKLLAGVKKAELLLKTGKYYESVNAYDEVAKTGPYNFYGTVAINKLNSMKWDRKNTKILKEFL